MSARLNAFDAKKQILLRRLANLTSVAIKNSRTLAQIRQELSEQESKNRIHNALMGASDLSEMASIYLNELLAVLDATIGALWLYDSVEDVMVQIAARGLHLDKKRHHKGENILWQIFSHREAHLSDEFQTDPQFGDDLRGEFPTGIGGALIPFTDDDEIIGVCLVGVKQPREITTGEVNLLTEIASVACGTICQMRELENTKRSLEQARGLQVIDQVISASMDLRLIFEVILDQVSELLHVDASDVLLLNAHTQTLEFAAGQGFQTAALKHTHLKLGQGHAGKAAIERRIVNIPNLMEDRNGFERAPLIPNERFVAYYAIPLISKGQIMGVMELFHRSLHEADLEWRKFLEVIATQAAIAIDNARLFENLQRTNAELTLAYDTTLEGWSRALELHDRTEHAQSDRAAEMATQLARELGVSEYDEVHIRRGAILHDIGKMGIPEDILNKEGPLTEDEWEIMRQHPVYAYDLLSPIPYLRPALDIPYCHHERWDGTGYPGGLIGEQIPLAARIFAVVDVWDSMLSNRPYRDALPEDEVLAYINNNAGKQFDPTAVQAFMNIVE
jgi:HD-GYP domain-containing protein (c-di-GMP phosphodiesterase class II)